MQADHEALTAKAVEGDEAALSQILELTGPLVRARIAGRIPAHLRSVLSEDDIMQQTYLDAFVAIGRFTSRGQDSFRAWLTTLAERNLCDAVRMLEADKRGGQRKRAESPGSDESLVALCEMLTASGTSPSGRAARHEAEGVLLTAIQQLPEDYRTVVQLYDLDNHPITEVAPALGRSPGAVFMMRSRAHDRLRQIMGTASAYLSTDA